MAEKSGDPYSAACVETAAGNPPAEAPKPLARATAWPGTAAGRHGMVAMATPEAAWPG